MQVVKTVKVPVHYALTKRKLAARKPLKKPKQMVRDVAESLREGDLIKVLWLDASESRNVRWVTNKVVATYTESVGHFLGLYRDHVYKQPHLLLSAERTEQKGFNVTSIPLAMVMKIMPP